MEFINCKPLFNRLDDTKKENILMTSIKEFSKEGFNSANINIIAELANVSVGAMYKYFGSKRNLYMTCVEMSKDHLNTVMQSIIKSDDDFMLLMEKIIMAIQDHSRKNIEFTKLYYEMATEGNSEYAMVISNVIEGATSDLYSSYIEKAKKNHHLREDIDPRFFAFFIDNLLLMLQFSYSCAYYQNRFKIYAYDNVFENDELVVSQMLEFIRGALFIRE